MTKKTNQPKRSKLEQFKALTWDDLHSWAGTTIVSRGKTYQHQKCVSQLANTPDGKLVAWVKGTEIYATQVEIDEDGLLDSSCSCPYWGTCKHAVAVVLEYLEQVKKGKNIPITDDNDERLLLSHGSWEDDDDDDEYFDEDDDEYDEYDEYFEDSKPSSFRGYLESQTKEQLVNLLDELANNYSQVRKVLQDKHNLATGNVENIVALIKEDISELGDVGDYYDDWDEYRGYNNEVDLSQLQQRLKDLLSQGQVEQVLSLGEEILSAGKHRVEMEEEGESAEEIIECMTVVFEAVAQSPMSVVEQMVWVIELESESDYDLCSGSHVFWEQEFSPENWSDLADVLIKNLKPLPKNKEQEDFPFNYRYDQTINLIIEALENADRKSEVISLCQSQVEHTRQGYTRLIEHLRKENRTEEVIEWIHKGIAATHKAHHGIANQLRKKFLEIQKEAQNWSQVAALEADEFFHSPSLHAFQTLENAAQQAKVLPAVRAAALEYLETGQSPVTVPPKTAKTTKTTKTAKTAKTTKTTKTTKETKNTRWPLPEPEVKISNKGFPIKFPARDTLIAIAIEEKQPDEVMRWYQAPETKMARFGSSHFDHQVANAVADAYPDTAIEIWKNTAERLIAETTVKSYQQAAPYLGKMQMLLEKNDRKSEWEDYLKALRTTHTRKWRLLEVLDGLTGKRIID